MEYHFKDKIESLLREQRRTKKSLYDTLGMSMQGFDSMMKNNTFSAARLGAVASFFNVEISYFYDIKSLRKERDENEGQYLQEHLLSLEQNFEKLLNQLSVKDHQLESKDQQINNLQEMLKTVLGKFERVINEPLFAQLGEFPQAEAKYTFATLNDVAQPLLVVN